MLDGGAGGLSDEETRARSALLSRLHLCVLLALLIAIGLAPFAGARLDGGVFLFLVACVPVFAWGAVTKTRRTRLHALVLVGPLFVTISGILIGFGPTPGASAAVAVLPILVGLFFGRGPARASALAVVLLYVVLGAAAGTGRLPLPAEGLFDLRRPAVWIRIGLVQASISLLVLSTVTTILSRVEQALGAKSRALAELRAEHERLEASEAGRRRAERALFEAQKLEALGRLAAGVAHDVNNQLFVIRNWSMLLGEELTPNETSRKGLSAIGTATENAEKVMRQLLTFARRGERSPAPCDAVSLVRRAVETLGRVFPKDIEVRLDAGDAVPLAFVDAGQLDQVVLNLALNARDAMPGGGKLTLRVERAERRAADGREQIAIRAIDTGTGMSDEVQRRVFEPFYTTKAEGKGTGLGLSTVFGIVQAHGGEIDVKSEPGRGSTFSVFLPVAPPTSPSPPLSHADPPSPA